MPYPNNYQYNSCTNTITIPNTTATQFSPCPQIISHRNDLPSVFDPKYTLNQKSGILNDESRRLERKREKNREAARKCRERKNQHVEVLESKLQKQQEAISQLKNKMKLVLNEMMRLDEYITKTDIPHCDLKDFSQIKDDVAVFLDLVESES
uniref:cAMP responsive element binding protein-1 n=1 Tax=Schmidtea mediterranea TaxID=79327 RepID=I1ZII7_SCHMD|nr:cAMP responsive element binding protein-1 [Schmidtea mediterranea]